MSGHPTETAVCGHISNVTVQNETGGFVGVGTDVLWIAHIDSSDRYVPVTYF